MQVFEEIARALGVEIIDTQQEVPVGPRGQLILDALLKTKDQTILVEVKGRPARKEDLAYLCLAREVMVQDQQETMDASELTAVLAAPTASSKIRDLAEASDVTLVEIPALLTPSEPDNVGTVPLTTEQSWGIVVTLLKGNKPRSIRELAKTAGVSTGWTHKVVKELEGRGILNRSMHGLSLDDAEPVLDLVPMERPFDDLRTRKIQTGIESIEELELTLQVNSSEIQSHAEGNPLHVCGTTAAAEYTGYLIQGDRLDVYFKAPSALEPLFEGQEGGVTLNVYEPDRTLASQNLRGGLLHVPEEIALLDVAGTGMAFRDLATKLLERMKAD